MDKGFQVLFSFRADCSVSEIGPLLISLGQLERISSRFEQPGRRKPLKVSVKSARELASICARTDVYIYVAVSAHLYV